MSSKRSLYISKILWKIIYTPVFNAFGLSCSGTMYIILAGGHCYKNASNVRIYIYILNTYRRLDGGVSMSRKCVYIYAERRSLPRHSRVGSTCIKTCVIYCSARTVIQFSRDVIIYL